MPNSAASIHFPSGDTGDAKPWSLGSPNRAVTIPHLSRRARESLAGRDDRYLQRHLEQKADHNRSYHASRRMGQGVHLEPQEPRE